MSIRWVVLLGVTAPLPGLGRAEPAVSFEQTDTSLRIRVGDKSFATYVWEDRAIRRPHFAHVQAPNGKQVTRTLPPVAGTDAVDHADMHPGLWLAFGDINGADFWRNKGVVKHAGFVEKPTTTKDGGSFAVRNTYLMGDKTVCEEVCRIRVRASAAGYLIDWTSEFTGPDDFSFGDQEEMGLGLRIATPLTVKKGGMILNSDGAKNEKAVWGKAADWCDYSAVLDGESVGVALMPDPKNFRRSWFHARDYGLLVANPFARKAFTKGEKSQVVVKKGETFRLRFGVLAHSGKADVAAAYKEWTAGVSGTERPTAVPKVDRDRPYTEPAAKRQTLDVYSSADGKDHPILVWIHGGGWQAGDKAEVHQKPKGFVDRGFVFVSVNYRLLPEATIGQMAGDVAKAIRWVHLHAKAYGGDSRQIVVGGHSAGAQLAALVCTDEQYLKAEGLSLANIRGCVPVDGDTYDVPMQIKTVEQRRADIYRKKFGPEESQKALSPVTHVAKDKKIPPFLILHVAEHPEVKGQSQRLVKALQEAGVSAKAYPAEGKTHATIDSELGSPDDEPTREMFEFLAGVVKK